MKSNKKRVLEKIINILLNILIVVFGIVLIVSIYSGIQTKVLGKNYTEFFGLSMFEVQTGSMSPEIEPGDWIIVKLTNDIKINDIITYEVSGEYVTHRIVSASGNVYVTKGDANNAKDEPINKNQIVGKVVNILPNIGIIRKILFNPLVFLTLIVTLLMINISFNKEKSEKFKIILFKLINSIKNLFNKLIFKKISLFLKRTKNKSENKKIIKSNRAMRIDEKVDFSDVEDSKDDDPDKATLFKVISVDSDEVDETLLEIVANEIKDDKEENKATPAEGNEEVESELESEAKLTKINLELLKNKTNRKGKNIIDSMIVFKIEELEEIIDLLNENKSYVNKTSIRNLFITLYIDARYYNFYGDREFDMKNKDLKIISVIREVASNLIKKYKGTDNKYNLIVNAYANSLMLISTLDQAKSLITDSKAKRKFYKKELVKYFKDINPSNHDNMVDAIIKIQRNYEGVLEYFLKKFETNMFELKFNKLNSKKEMYALQLIHNIEFSKIYSDYIIDKTYTEGVIAEDKMGVLLSLLLVRLIKDMNESNFNREYVLPFPTTLYTKGKKYEKFLRMIEDKYAKENVIILICFEDLIKNKSFVRDIKKEGYRFALVFNNDVEIDEKDYAILNIMDYVFISKGKVNSIKLLTYLPEDVLDNIIYEDIIEKVGGARSEN